MMNDREMRATTWAGSARLLTVALLALLPARVEAADEKRACASAYERAQQLRRSGSLRASREQLLICAQDRCPDVARVDCVRWLREVDDAIPTLVVRARDPSGSDLADVRVFVDDVLLAPRLDGQPLVVDPGEHTLRLEHGDGPPLEQHLVVVMGEKNRIVAVTLPGEVPSLPRVAPVQPARPEPSPPSRFPTAAAILAGVGVIAAGVSTYFEVAGIGDRRHLFNTCAGHCSQSDVDFAYRELRAGDVAAGVALVSLAGAIWLYLAK
jgi:hypothetical protein